MIKLSTLIPNAENPRTIKDVKFAQLVENIRKYPKFLEKRPIVIESLSNPVIIGGNMRFLGLKHLGYTEIPDEWIKTADDFSEEELKAFVVLDNVQFGDFDYDLLANNYDYDELLSLGLEIPELNEITNINLDDFFEDKKVKEEIVTEKFSITLDYSKADYDKVLAGLKNVADSPAEAVKTLLEL